MAGPIVAARHLISAAIPLGPSRRDAAWALEHLNEAERALWQQLRRADRRRAARGARSAASALGERATVPVVAAALLHDVGKLDARFGPYRRFIAELSMYAVHEDPDVFRAWARTTGFTRRVGLYAQHPKAGGDLLGIAGSDALTEAWTREHHLAEEHWTIPVEIGRALHAADDA
jgi:hypothetical protein